MSRKTSPRPRSALDKPRGGGLTKQDAVELAVNQLPVPPILLNVLEKAWWRNAVGTLGFVTRIVETVSVHDLKWSQSMLAHYRAKGLGLADVAPERLAEHAAALREAVESAALHTREKP